MLIHLILAYKEEQLQELMTEEDTKKEEEKIEAKIKQLSLKRLGVAQQMKVKKKE